jgi:heme exporter protein D
MTHAGYVLGGWGITLLVLAAYSVRLVRRGRRLAARVPPSERRWTSP